MIQEQRDYSVHEPSLEEIAMACAEIRKGWSEREHRVRAGMVEARTWTLPIAKCGARFVDLRE